MRHALKVLGDHLECCFEPSEVSVQSFRGQLTASKSRFLGLKGAVSSMDCLLGFLALVSKSLLRLSCFLGLFSTNFYRRLAKYH